jgi:hypothetical protein
MLQTNPISDVATVIIERLSPDRWQAWIKDVQQVPVRGDGALHAFQRLLDLIGPNYFVTTEITAINEATRDDRLEFRIPRVALNGFPGASAN